MKNSKEDIVVPRSIGWGQVLVDMIVASIMSTNLLLAVIPRIGTVWQWYELALVAILGSLIVVTLVRAGTLAALKEYHHFNYKYYRNEAMLEHLKKEMYRNRRGGGDDIDWDKEEEEYRRALKNESFIDRVRAEYHTYEDDDEGDKMR